jgi:hypothetical protein
MGTTDTNQQVAFLMNEGGFTADEARKLAGISTEVLSQNATYLSYRQSLSSGERWDVVTRIVPDQSYSPTEEEIMKSTSSGMQVYNMTGKFYEIDGVPAMTLSYFVPYTAMSEELLAAIKPSQNLPVSAGMVNVLPSAEAAGGLAGAGFDLFSLGTSMQFRNDQSAELERLMDCAQNPTNPVTRMTYEANPQERQRNLDEIRSAQSELSRLSTARILNQLGKGPALVTHMNPVIHVITEAASEWSEHTLSHLAEERVEQARRSVVPCDNSISIPSIPTITSVSGTITYEYNEEGEGPQGRGDYGEWEDKMSSVGQFSTGSSGKGNGTATWERTLTYKNTAPPTVLDQYTLASSTKEQGSLILKAEVSFNSITVEGSGTASVEMTRSFMQHTGRGWEQHEAQPWHGEGGVKGFLCVFEEVDLLNSGSYSVETEGGNGACSLEISVL